MKSVFVLQHVRLSGSDEDVKLLGVYSSKANADDAIRRFEKRPGFAEARDGFSVDEYLLDSDYWDQGFGV